MWVYKDAKRVSHEEAAQYGLEPGRIVLVGALAGTPEESGDRGTAEGAAGQQVGSFTSQALILDRCLHCTVCAVCCWLTASGGAAGCSE